MVVNVQYTLVAHEYLRSSRALSSWNNVLNNNTIAAKTMNNTMTVRSCLRRCARVVVVEVNGSTNPPNVGAAAQALRHMSERGTKRLQHSRCPLQSTASDDDTKRRYRPGRAPPEALIPVVVGSSQPDRRRGRGCLPWSRSIRHRWLLPPHRDTGRRADPWRCATSTTTRRAPTPRLREATHATGHATRRGRSDNQTSTWKGAANSTRPQHP